MRYLVFPRAWVCVPCVCACGRLAPVPLTWWWRGGLTGQRWPLPPAVAVVASARTGSRAALRTGSRAAHPATRRGALRRQVWLETAWNVAALTRRSGRRSVPLVVSSVVRSQALVMVGRAVACCVPVMEPETASFDG